MAFVYQDILFLFAIIAFAADYVEQAHFGGGMFKKKANAENGEAEQPKSRKDVMLDIIAKSKTAKV